jgi:tetratricopeptide (TPR) repeat protein
MRLPLSVVLLGSLLIADVVCAASDPGSESTELRAAIELFTSRRYPEARAALEKIVAAQPNNAAAHHYLGRTLAARNDNAALEQGLSQLTRAVELEPTNPVYLGIFGGISLQYAGRTNSISAATRGRDAMEKALTIDPDYLDAREGLFQFYQRAPWPMGSSAKAAAQLAEIRKRNPDLATILEVTNRTAAKDFATAFKLCENVLARQSDNYTALYHLGRTASISGQQLEHGLACLQKCLSLPPPSPASPSYSNVWQRIGNIHEQLKQPEKARAAYTTALELDPSNRQASDALAKLK